jgi:hypothetical protein
MSKQIIPLVADDISQFSRALTKQILQNDEPLTHVKMLNLLAKANGFRNFQHMRSAHKFQQKLSDEKPTTIDYKLVSKCLNQFDQSGVLMRWPAKNAVQKICIWAIWAHLPKATSLNERQISALINEVHTFNDPATLRRIMVGYQMLERNKDGSAYLRIEQAPSAEAVELISQLKRRGS